ncbi:MAG TPA: DUF2164 domain-containing protein [Myxococcota bacterium]|nr:DUF2164 domain-containing protein [Myxococcota bacterium]
MAIELDKERKQRMVRAIQTYFVEKLDQEIGQLAAELLLEFFVKQVGPTIYNQAVKDAQAFLQDKLMDLDGVLYQPEEPRSR